MRSDAGNVVVLSAQEPSRPLVATGAGTHFDPKVAQFFAEMRRHLGQPRHVIAHRIGTSEMVLTALEGGDLIGIPSGDALIRVVAAYTALLGLDPRPILAHIEDARAGWLAPVVPAAPAYSPQLLSALNEFTPSPAPPSAQRVSVFPSQAAQALPLAEVPTAEDDERSMRARQRRRRRLVRTLNLGALAVVLTISAGILVQHSAAVYEAIGQLPKHIAQPARATYEAVLAVVAPSGGHQARRSAPSTEQPRRTDKLPSEAK